MLSTAADAVFLNLLPKTAYIIVLISSQFLADSVYL